MDLTPLPEQVAAISRHDMIVAVQREINQRKRVYQRLVETGRMTGSTLGFRVCEADEFVDGAAEEIARCLNRLPKAEAFLIYLASSIRAGTLPQPLADQIEEFMVNGV